MKKLLLVLFFTAMGMFKGQSQALVQTYIDRCTGQVSVFSVSMGGNTIVAFYNRSRSFTSQDFQNGTLQSWLEETYLWWTSLSPCSTTTTGAQATQQTTQQTTQQAANAAASAASQAATTPTPNVPTTTPPTTTTAPTTTTPDTSSANTTTPDTTSTGANTSSPGNSSTGTSGSTDSTGSSQSNTSNTESTSTAETTSTETTNESTSSETQDTESGTSGDEGGTEESTEVESTTEESTEETTTEESTEETTEESTEESTEEESTEESTEEESTEEESKEESDEETEDKESEEDTEEESDEEESKSDEDEETEEEDTEEESNDKDKKKDKKKKKKKRSLAPPIVTANAMSQQLPTGEFQQAVTLGVSRSSLMGTETYGLNAMVYDNLQQYMLSASFSKVHINKEGRVNRVYSASLGGMKMYSTYMGMMNHSVTFLGKKGSVAGIAFGTSITTNEVDIIDGFISFDNQLLGLSLTGFYTKSIQVTDKLSISPMLAVSSPFMMFDMLEHTTMWNSDLMIIGGSSFSYKLTQRFGLNLGANVIESTAENFPTMVAFTIGGRISF